MIRFTAFRTQKPRQFEYKPRHYDPDKEAREQRRREILGARASDVPEGEYVPGQYVRQMKYTREARGSMRKKYRANPIRMVILLILAGFVLWFFFR